MKLKLTTLIATAIISMNAMATEIIHYTNKPITINLKNGEERMIQFGDHVAVGVSVDQEVKRLFRVQSAQGALHIRPNKVFGKERIQVKRINDGKVVLIDLVSSDSTSEVPLEDVRIYVGNEAKDIPVATSKDNENSDLGLSAPREPISPITLTRYASQMLYAPQRLHKLNPAISEAHLGNLQEKSVRAFKGINRTNTSVKPILAYKADNLYIAALLVRNTSYEPVTLNYLDINLPFTHATYQHHKLNRKGVAGDRTILYIVNDRPLEDTLIPWTFYTDEKLRIKAEAEQKAKEKRAAAGGLDYEG